MPHTDPLNEDRADARIQEKIASFGGDKQQRGLARVNEGLKEAGIPADVRLHLISAVTGLSRLGETTREARMERARGE